MTTSHFLLLFAAIFAFTTSSLGARLPTRELTERDDGLPARVPYIFPPPGTDPIADAIRARRADGILLTLDGVLLNAPLVASGWNDYFGVIRDNNTLPAPMRELIILRAAALNGASYEWIQHEPVGRSVGLTTAQLRTIRLAPAFSQDKSVTQTLGPALSAMFAYTDWMTKNVHVSDDVFNALKNFLNDKQIVEATATVGGYALVSRFIVALDVDGKMNVPVPIPS